MIVQPTVTTVTRESIRAISSVTVNGEVHQLGEQRDFRRHEALARFLPDNSRPSFAWVRLRDGETLQVHKHPVKSMILVCNGSVELIGDNQRMLREGDIVCVPEHSLHGFRTVSGEVFHGLSIQFDGKGLYEEENAPRVHFEAQYSGLTELEVLNQQLAQQHTNNALFQLMRRECLHKQPDLRERFVSALYVWSRYFQKMLQARQAMCVNNNLNSIYKQHFDEEYNHDVMLSDNYNVDKKMYCPALEAACSWFVSQMYQLDEAQKIVVVHLVVESSGHIFGEKSANIFEKKSLQNDYFSLHAQADTDHTMMGRDYLKALSPTVLYELKAVCRQAWEHMDLVHECIANWILE